MGTAIAYPLVDNGHEVRLVGTHLDEEIIARCREQRFHPRLERKLPPAVRPYYAHEISGALNAVDVIISGVSSNGVRWVGRAIGPHLEPGQLILSVTKGFESADNGDLRILPDVLAESLPECIRDQVKIAAVGGPCVADELAGRRETCVVFGSRDLDTAERLAALLTTSYYHVSTTVDLVGLEICAALKNAYTLSVGIAAGLLEQVGGPDVAGARTHNLAAACFAQSVTEMDGMLRVMGCERSLAAGLPGAGDLYVTCQRGRSLRLGRLLGLGHSYSMAQKAMAGDTLEAAACVQVMGDALPKLAARGVVSPHDFPLMRALVDVVVRGGKPDLPLGSFRGSRRGAE
jgi:glycerol-3-phosphate dehydrogenase (NAD(P)+)